MRADKLKVHKKDSTSSREGLGPLAHGSYWSLPKPHTGKEKQDRAMASKRTSDIKKTKLTVGKGLCAGAL